MSASTEALRDGSYIQFSLAAQTYAVTTVAEFTKKGCNLDALNGQGVIYQAFTVLVDRAHPIHLLAGYPYPRERAFAVQVAERGPEQAHLGG